MLATWRIGPALAAGNTVVYKPPEWAPLTASLLADITTEAGVPAGVFNVVQGLGARRAPPLTASRRPRGSASPARCRPPASIAEAAAPNIVPLSVRTRRQVAVRRLRRRRSRPRGQPAVEQFDNAGQVCLAGIRILVEDRSTTTSSTLCSKGADDRSGRSTRRGDRHRPADQPASTSSGSTASCAGPRQPAPALLGGAPNEQLGGLYYRPTILVDARPGQRDPDRGGVRAGAHRADLLQRGAGDRDGQRHASTAWPRPCTGDPERAERVSAQLNAGTVWVNCFFVRDLRRTVRWERQIRDRS